MASPQRHRAQDYFRAVRQDVAQTAVKLPVVQGDFFTYADKDQEVELRGEIDNRSMHSPFTEIFSCCSHVLGAMCLLKALPPQYWSGYFASRTFYKSMTRRLSRKLRAAEAIFVVGMFPLTARERSSNVQRLRMTRVTVCSWRARDVSAKTSSSVRVGARHAGSLLCTPIHAPPADLSWMRTLLQDARRALGLFQHHDGITGEDARTGGVVIQPCAHDRHR